MVSRRKFIERTSAGMLGTMVVPAIMQSCLKPGTMELNIDWKDFLSRHDMLWKRLPKNWREAPWTGNGMLGSMLWGENDALRLQVFRGDVQSHRPMSQGFSGYTRTRLQIGSFYFTPSGVPQDCDMRLSYYDAELSGTVTTTTGSIKIRHFTHSTDMFIF